MAAKIIKVIFLSLFVSLSAYSNTGYGNLKLSANVVVTFQKYLDFNSVHNKSKGPDAWGRPGMFSISKDGLVAGYGYCPRGKQCRPSPSVALNSCRNRGGDNCQIFAKGRKIVWNKVNHRISRKATRSEIVKILEDLSFYGDNESKIKPFISKKKKNHVLHTSCKGPRTAKKEKGFKRSTRGHLECGVLERRKKHTKHSERIPRVTDLEYGGKKKTKRFRFRFPWENRNNTLLFSRKP